MDKIIRASNLQKALEDYDSLKGQPVLFVYTLPESPNIRTRVYCKQDVTTVTELFDLKIEGLVEEFADEYATGQYVIKSGYTVKYHNTNVGSVEISQGTVTLYEDQFTTALTDSFNLTDKYTFDVTLTVTEMAYYIGDGTNQILYPVVTFGVIEEVKSKIEKVYNTLDNKIDELADNFATDNLMVNNAVIDNAQVNNFDVSTLIANGSSGTDGQYLGKNNGNIEWVTPPFDTNHLYVNHLTVNENASIDNLGVNNVNVNGDNFTHKSFDVTSMTVISEDDYNNLDWNFRNQAFYLTSPNGNMYFHGIQYAPSVPVKQGPCVEAYVDLPNMASKMGTLTTSTLTFTSGAVTNNFVNGDAYNGGFFKSSPFNFGWDNSLSIGTQANTGSIITNANELYIIDASFMYEGCQDLRDTFICNPSLISGAPANYDPMKYCTNMVRTFSLCDTLFLNPGLRGITIPNSVTNMAGTFVGCHTLNQPVTIPNSVTDMNITFALCYEFNQPVTIPNSVTDMNNTFHYCTELASSSVPIHISHEIALGDTSNYIYNSLVNGLTGISFAPSRILNDA
ncbi:MAG: BspA family leucine-rich repeat surface protein [Bacteroidales bacterium]|nr:BspA family leucine-rich repeat surface protein [Bacteroidales bacterium]